MVEQRHGQEAEPGANEAEGELAVSDPGHPGVLEEVAADRVRLSQGNGGSHDVDKGAKAEEVAKGLIPA